VANLGANLWGHGEEGKTASIRAGRIQYKTRCQNWAGCSQPAVIRIECRDNIGHPFWNRDYCEAHAQFVLKRAEARGIPVSWFYKTEVMCMSDFVGDPLDSRSLADLASRLYHIGDSLRAKFLGNLCRS
jgi:hypothetical protein